MTTNKSHRDDGIRIPEQLIVANAERLKDIPLNKKKAGRVISFWPAASIAAALALIVTIAWPSQQPTTKDWNQISWSEDDLIEVYENGLIDFDLQTLAEENLVDGSEWTTLPEVEDVDQLLDEFSDEELYELLN